MDTKTLTSLRSLDSRISVKPEIAVKKHWSWLQKEMELEFALQSLGEREFIEASILHDVQVSKARSIILDKREFQAALRTGPEY